MRIFELPLPLWPGHELTLGILVERQSRMNVGSVVYLGNGQIPNGEIVGCTITLPGTCDDSLAIFVKGLPLKDDDELSGSDDLEYDLFALAATAGITLATGDLIELFSKDNQSGQWSAQPWTATLTFDDSEVRTISGGEAQDGISDTVPKYRQMGSFTLGAVNQATSYQRLGAHQWHAMAGSLTLDYAADAPIIDDEGLTIEITGADTELDEYTDFNAFADDLLVLIGDELFSVSGSTLLGTGRYRLSVFRARLGTSKQAHAAGDAVYLFSKDELYSFTHAIAQPGNELALKVALVGGNGRGDASEVDPVAFSVTGVHVAPRIANLSANGDISGAVRPTGTDLELAWSLPDFVDIPQGWSFQTRIEILYLGVIYLSRLCDGESTTVTTAEFDASEFTVRATLEGTANGQTVKSAAVELTVQRI